MNREIKFRVWDIELHMWINNIGMGKDNTLCKGTEKRFHVMQYTGLKDKNGKEIYEGDIIKCGSIIMQVVYKQESCQFWLIWKDSEGRSRYKPITATYGDDTGYFSNDSLEIIGNVNENPELLKP